MSAYRARATGGPEGSLSERRGSGAQGVSMFRAGLLLTATLGLAGALCLGTVLVTRAATAPATRAALVPAPRAAAPASGSYAAPVIKLAAAPGRVLNVRDFGAKGDGATNDRDALQRTANAAQPGDTIYFPPGTYVDDDGLQIATSGVTLMGDGPTSVIKLFYRPALILGNGQPLTGLVVKRLKFLGLPGLYQRDGNTSEAISIDGPKGTDIEDCDFQGSGYAVYDGGSAGTTYGTVIRNCRVNGWGTVAIFCNGGEQITNCSLVQDDPDPNGQRSSHGLYIHSGCTNVRVADTLIENARKYGAQIWGHDPQTTVSNVQFERVTFKNCFSALTIQQVDPTAARAKDILIKGCSFLNSYGGPAVSVKQGDGIQILNNTIDGSAGAGLQLGVWAPYEPRFSVTDLLASGNTISQCDRGIWAQASWGGTFQNVRLLENTIADCRVLVDISDAPGVTAAP